MNHIISAIVDHGGAVKEFRIRRRDGSAMPAWTAGAHVQLTFTLPDGSEAERHYSLLGQPGNVEEYRIAVLLDPEGRGGSRHLHTQLRIGDAVTLGGPYNSFRLAAATGRTILVAGGIGVTPLLSMAHELAHAGISVEFHYLARSEERLVLLDEIEAIPRIQMHVHLSGTGERSDLASMIGAYTQGAAIYACGPVTLLQEISRIASLQGWPQSSLHVESFGARSSAGDEPLEVHLAQSGLTIQAEPGTSLLDALLEAGAFMPFDCNRGECGSCYTQVLEGAPLHRDVCLTEPQRAIGMCPCVSWGGGGRLVLDI
ncbi:PDR/VanB family oxidoreductase [Undibacterium sp. TJN25]|uniref:PDR/VanB family oxidoreductase n=1 Tax=Undibacterium sp. TJN25 TaxID=3413056 RepID=UPI003BF12583